MGDCEGGILYPVSRPHMINELFFLLNTNTSVNIETKYAQMRHCIVVLALQ